MKKFWVKSWIAALMLVATGACAPERPGPSVGPQASSATDRFPVRVVNETASNLRVFALYGGRETLLGRVGALGERTMQLPAAGTVQLVARPGAGPAGPRRHLSEQVQVMSGQRITWQLRMSPGSSDVPRLSTVWVYTCSGEADC